jgi:hypothetical protein
MPRLRLLIWIIILSFGNLVFADTVVLRDGSSYSGQFEGGAITFIDGQGIKYEFPVRDVQSLAFTSTSDGVTLRSGKSYSGHFTGAVPIGFQDSQGIKYQFPPSDIDAIVFSQAGSAVAASVPNGAKVIPNGSDLSVRTNENIDSASSYEGQTYSATITEPVSDVAGNVAIPAGADAKLLIRKISAGGAVHSPELVLDLYSITIDKKQYKVVSSDLEETNRKGLGANRRTAEFLGGGSALGALMGGIFGGGKGAGIGALAGAGGGFVSQVFTRGKEVRIPSESTLRFRLEKTLVLQTAVQ